MSGPRPPLSLGPRLISGSSASGRGRPPVSPRSPAVPHHGASPSSTAQGMAARTGAPGSPDRCRAGRRDIPVESAGGSGGSSALGSDLPGDLQPPPAPLRTSAPPRPNGARDTVGGHTSQVRCPSLCRSWGGVQSAHCNHVFATRVPPWTD